MMVLSLLEQRLYLYPMLDRLRLLLRWMVVLSMPLKYEWMEMLLWIVQEVGLDKASKAIGQILPTCLLIGSVLQLPVIDRRLSQMTEGDIIGLPCLKDGTTKFLPVDWIKIASQRPVLLFLDEINRASLEVQQAVFQLVLDRELNGLRLHPETRVYTAVNNGMSYQVNNMDPALLRRFWTVDLEPTVKDWLAWAKLSDDMDPVIISFISENSQFLQTSSEERHRTTNSVSCIRYSTDTLQISTG